MFTPVETAIGALLLQFATTSNLVLSGRTVGFSSLVYNSIFSPSAHGVSLVIGVLVATLFAQIQLPELVPVFTNATDFQIERLIHLNVPKVITNIIYSSPFGSQIDILFTPFALSYIFYAIAGLLVGYGTNKGAGCTSGHMLCGLSRLRVRSLVATISFFLTSAFVVNYFDIAPTCSPYFCYEFDKRFTFVKSNSSILFSIVLTSFLTSYLILPKFIIPLTSKVGGNIITGFHTGFVFGLGLFISGMANPAKPLGFLSFFHLSKFDPSLGIIMIFTVLPNIFIWKSSRIMKLKKPLIKNESFHLPTAKDIPLSMIFGNIIFGLGWGLMGICPGPGLMSLVLNKYKGVIWIMGFLLGYFLAKKI